MSKRIDCSNTDLLDGFLLFEDMETSFNSNIWFQYFCLLNIYTMIRYLMKAKEFLDILPLIIILSVFTLEVIPRLGSVS